MTELGSGRPRASCRQSIGETVSHAGPTFRTIAIALLRLTHVRGSATLQRKSLGAPKLFRTEGPIVEQELPWKKEGFAAVIGSAALALVVTLAESTVARPQITRGWVSHITLMSQRRSANRPAAALGHP